MKLKTSLRIAALVGASLMAATTAQAVELIVNGGFEVNRPVAGGTINYSGAAGPTGWAHVGRTVTALDTAYTEGPTVFFAHTGNVSMDLTGPSNTGPTSGLAQTVATSTGQFYRLSFWLGNAQSTAVQSYNLASSLTLQIDGGMATTFSNADITSNGNNWRQFSHDFAAAGALTTITFRNATPLTDNQTGLDDVSLTALAVQPAVVPEPTTWALMIGGFGLVGAALRRRALVPA